MKPIKRVDIVVDHAHAGPMVRALEELGVAGYTVVPGAQGQGRRGMQHADGLMNAASNDLIFTTCDADELARVTTTIRPLLKRFGGICLVSDVGWLEH